MTQSFIAFSPGLELNIAFLTGWRELLLLLWLLMKRVTVEQWEKRAVESAL